MTQQDQASFEDLSKRVSERPELKKLLDMKLALSHAPNLEELRLFIEYIEKAVDKPLPGFNEVQFYKQAVDKYYKKHPVPVEGQKLSMAQKISGGVTQNNNNQADQEGVKENTPTNPEIPITIGYTGKQHFKHLNKDTKLPKNITELLDFVNENAGIFYKKGDHWTIQLGDEPTKKYGGGYEIKPWSILISKNSWQVFHYGPTGIEKD
jgi:hypothetical protein